MSTDCLRSTYYTPLVHSMPFGTIRADEPFRSAAKAHLLIRYLQLPFCTQLEVVWFCSFYLTVKVSPDFYIGGNFLIWEI